MNWFTRIFAKSKEPAVVPNDGPFAASKLSRARDAAVANGYAFEKPADFHNIQARKYEVKAPALAPGVVPEGGSAPVLAMDDYGYNAYAGSQQIDFTGFPGYPYLAMLTTRAEYRQMSSALSTELTREWITLNSTETSGDNTKKKITELTKVLADLCIQQLFMGCAEDDFNFGRAQIGISVDGQKLDKPLVLSEKTLPRWTDFKKTKTCPVKFKKVEPMWTTPATFNASDPLADDFYKPTIWYMMGTRIHASRLPTIITRPVPDILKPAFNFSGISGIQLAEPYVNNWLRTRQSVSDMLNNFSITVLKTSMGTLLQSSQALINRIKLFITNRSNNGLMVMDKNTEDLAIQNVPLGGLDALQAQAQEHLCSVSRMPAVILTGIEPSGLNASSDGSIRVFYDWIHAQQEAHYRRPLQLILNILQIVMYGEIDEDINFTFDPLYQMTPKELADIKKSEAESDAIYITNSIILPEEARQRVASDPRTGYSGLQMDIEIGAPEQEDDEEEEE